MKAVRERARWRRRAAAALLLFFPTAGLAEEKDPRARGAELYRTLCADCHGPTGQGSDYHASPLAGDLPVVELARVITETMPEGDPETCVGAEAELIARHVHESFYSPLARARIRPPRRELSRLTARQHEQSLADVMASYLGRQPMGDKRGVKVRFVRKLNTGQVGEAEETLLPKLSFSLNDLDQLPDDFRSKEAEGQEEFGNKRIDVDVSANAGLWAPRTGRYEFVARTPNAVRLTINDQPVIDAKIRSEGEDQVAGRVWLVGGRVYPLHLTTTRTIEDDIYLDLRWRPPGSVEETIPERRFTPGWRPRVGVSGVAFPPDDRSVGYVRGASVSREWWDAVARSAIEAARLVADDPRAVEATADEPSRWRDEAIAFCERLAESAYRRPLSEAEKQGVILRFFDEQTPRAALEQSVLAVLTSPGFLYPEARSDESSHDQLVASRLALSLWDSIPDKALRKQAARARLHDPEPVRQQARRMLRDERTRSKIDEFFEHWLRLDQGPRFSRDPQRFPDFDDRVAADMRASLKHLIHEVVWESDGDLRRLFTTKDLYVNRRLADFLGIEAPTGDDPQAFVAAGADTRLRAGVVTHPYLVTSLAYYRDTSPIHRGVFLARHILGRSLRPPPEAVAPLPPEIEPDMTTRQRVAKQTSPHACRGCHVLINDLGFTLEHFDAVGRFRERDTGQPVDSTGGYIATDGRRTELRDAEALAEYLANAEDVHRSFVVQLFEHLTKQPMLAFGVETQESLLRRFRESGYDVRELIVESAVAAALADPPQPPPR